MGHRVETGQMDGFGWINNPDIGRLSHCNRAKILIKLWILTVIAEHFFVLIVCVCSYLYERLCVCAQMYLFSPLVQCTYIGPTVHIHNFLLSLKQRAHSSFSLIQTTFLLKTDQARPAFHFRYSSAITPHPSNLCIIWIIIDQTQLSISHWHQLLRLTKCFVNKLP